MDIPRRAEHPRSSRRTAPRRAGPWWSGARAGASEGRGELRRGVDPPGSEAVQNGDTVEIDGQVGVLVDVDARVTILRTLDNEEVRIPNGAVISSSLVNLTSSPHRRTLITVGVAYDSDLERAHSVIMAALARVSRVMTEPAPVAVLSRFGSSGIDFDVHVWHRSDIRSELATRHDVILALHRAFSAEGIVIAFPQLVVWTGSEPAVEGPYAEHSEVIRTELPSDVVEQAEPRLSFAALRSGSRLRLRLSRRRRPPGGSRTET